MRARGFAGLPRIVWLLGFASLLNDVSSEAIFPLLPLFLAELGAGATALGVIEGAADAMAAAAKVVAGRLSDRGPRRLFVLGGYTLPAVARAGIAAAVAPWNVLVARLVDRLGKGIRSGPRDALLAEAAPAGAVGKAFGLQRSMDHFGAAIGPLAASALVASGASLRTTFALAAAAGLAAPLLLAWRLKGKDATSAAAAPSPRPPPPASAGGEGELARPLTAEGDLARPSTTSAGPRPLAPRLPRPLRRYILLAALFAFANSTDAFLLLRAREVGVSAGAVPLLWFLHHVVKTAAGVPGGMLSDRWPRAAIVAAGWGAYALAYIGFAFASSPLQVAGLFAFYAAYHGLAEGAERALVADLAPEGARGAAFGWYHGVVGAAALPAGLVTGALWTRHGSAVALTTCAAIAGVAAALLAGSRLARTHVPRSAP